MEPRNRQELATQFDWALSRPQVRGPNKRNRPTVVKSYIVESTVSEKSGSSAAADVLEGTLSKLDVFSTHTFSFAIAEEKTLARANGKVGKEAVELHIDFTNPRYWLVHSISDSDALDRLTSRWTSGAPEIDRAWFPIQLLMEFRELGRLTGVSLQFDSLKFRQTTKSTFDRNEELKMRFNGTQAETVLQTVRSPGSGFEHQAALSSIRLRDNSDTYKLISDIRHDGRITARGDSFSEHNYVVTSVLRSYRDVISRLEAEYALKTEIVNSQLRIAGRPICVRLHEPIEDVQAFCEKVFSCAEPFRLFGVPSRIEDDYYYVQAIDMHTSGLLRFEVLPKLIRVFLLRGTCGNAVLRFITNLQHSLDARIALEMPTSAGAHV